MVDDPLPRLPESSLHSSENSHGSSHSPPTSPSTQHFHWLMEIGFSPRHLPSSSLQLLAGRRRRRSFGAASTAAVVAGRWLPREWLPSQRVSQASLWRFKAWRSASSGSGITFKYEVAHVKLYGVGQFADAFACD